MYEKMVFLARNGKLRDGGSDGPAHSIWEIFGREEIL